VNVRSVLEDAAQRIGCDVLVSARLVSGNVTVLVDGGCSSDHQSTNAIRLPHELVQVALLDNVPAYLGGSNLYDDDATVQGMLEAVTLCGEEVLMLRPRSIELWRGGETYVVELPR
jgi:hypothetical protein